MERTETLEKVYREEEEFRDQESEHDEFEAQVVAHFEEMGFIVKSLAYSRKKFAEKSKQFPFDFDKRAVDALKFNPNWTSLHLRIQADLVVIEPKDNGLVFYVEIKHTPKSENGDRLWMNIPLYQFGDHYVMNRWFGVECLYVFRNDDSGLEKGFWTQDIPRVRLAFIPNAWNNLEPDILPIYKTIVKKCFSEYEVNVQTGVKRVRGSGNPYLAVMPDKWKELKDWQEVVLKKIMERRHGKS